MRIVVVMKHLTETIDGKPHPQRSRPKLSSCEPQRGFTIAGDQPEEGRSTCSRNVVIP